MRRFPQRCISGACRVGRSAGRHPHPGRRLTQARLWGLICFDRHIFNRYGFSVLAAAHRRYGRYGKLT
jgi:hypothetical protein